jgi:hypothetical protein
MTARAHLGPQIAGRQSRTQDVLALFKASPGRWIDVHTLAHVGGFAAWRSRVSDARQIVVKGGEGNIEWNGVPEESAYRFTPFVALGPDPAHYREQQSLF